jgi:hypothetical protein
MMKSDSMGFKVHEEPSIEQLAMPDTVIETRRKGNESGRREKQTSSHSGRMRL